MPCSQPAISGDFGISGEGPDRAVEDDLGDGSNEQQRQQRGERGRPRSRRARTSAALALGGDAHEAARAHNAVHTVLVSRYASRPSWPCSRPMPEALKPPNGADGSTTPQVLM